MVTVGLLARDVVWFLIVLLDYLVLLCFSFIVRLIGVTILLLIWCLYVCCWCCCLRCFVTFVILGGCLTGFGGVLLLVCVYLLFALFCLV